jgi:hypothetical protein
MDQTQNATHEQSYASSAAAQAVARFIAILTTRLGKATSALCRPASASHPRRRR